MITRGLCSYNARLFNDDVTAIHVSYWWRREFRNYARLHRGRMNINGKIWFAYMLMWKQSLTFSRYAKWYQKSIADITFQASLFTTSHSPITHIMLIYDCWYSNFCYFQMVFLKSRIRNSYSNKSMVETSLNIHFRIHIYAGISL